MPFDVFYAGRLLETMIGGKAHERRVDLTFGLDFYVKAGHAKPSPENLHETHVYVCTTPLSDKEEIFEAFQGEFCEPSLHRSVENVGASHLSMSVGDILRDTHTGALWLVEPLGFTHLK